jgi:uncharacterized protein YbgA (DUF1722 family)
MRIWDIHPGYLNRQSLLGEHRELHGIVSIIMNGKKGYSKHPETIRWTGFPWGLNKRHELLAAEMSIRGYSDQSPVQITGLTPSWPPEYIDSPFRQFQILKNKYEGKTQGRIPLPENSQQLWSQHKYSIMARDVSLYKLIGKKAATDRTRVFFEELADLLAGKLREVPETGGIRNTLQHMWGHISEYSNVKGADIDQFSLPALLEEVQRTALASGNQYLLASTALSELAVWIREKEQLK